MAPAAGLIHVLTPKLRTTGEPIERYTVDEFIAYFRDRGIDSAPIELMDGMMVLIDKSSPGMEVTKVGPHHAYAAEAVSDLRAKLPEGPFHLRAEKPLAMPPGNMPQPDGAIVRGSRRDYREGHPRADECLCVFEVSDSSLDYDRTTKLAFYAGAGVPVYVIVNLVDDVVEVRTEPDRSTGEYATTNRVARGERFTIRLGERASLDVAANDLLL